MVFTHKAPLVQIGTQFSYRRKIFHKMEIVTSQQTNEKENNKIKVPLNHMLHFLDLKVSVNLKIIRVQNR